MYSINKSEGLPGLARAFSAAASITGNPSYRASAAHHECIVPINHMHLMNKCTHCEMSKICIKKVLISARSSSLPKGEYWKQCVPVSSITRSATSGLSSALLTNSFHHVNLFQVKLEYTKLFLLALQNAGGLLI